MATVSHVGNTIIKLYFCESHCKLGTIQSVKTLPMHIIFSFDGLAFGLPASLPVHNTCVLVLIVWVKIFLKTKVITISTLIYCLTKNKLTVHYLKTRLSLVKLL